MATPFTVADAENAAFWRKLRPDLSVEAEPSAEPFKLGDVAALMAVLRFEGYVNVPAVVPEKLVVDLRRCVECLHAREIPLAFAFVYDQFWQLFSGLSEFIGTALGKGYRALPDFWVWHVLASEGAIGWAPHRDRLQPTLDHNNSPHSMTVWVPLSDATPLNGCIYMLPAHQDERFKRRVWDGEDNNHVADPQNIRALPATAGSMLAWNQAVLHWGGRASRLAAAPRSSAAFEFQRGDRPPFNKPLLDPSRAPPFRQRLGLVGKQVIQYKHMYPLTPEIASIAESLRTRFMPGGAVLAL